MKDYFNWRKKEVYFNLIIFWLTPYQVYNFISGVRTVWVIGTFLHFYECLVRFTRFHVFVFFFFLVFFLASTLFPFFALSCCLGSLLFPQNRRWRRRMMTTRKFTILLRPRRLLSVYTRCTCVIKRKAMYSKTICSR